MLLVVLFPRRFCAWLVTERCRRRRANNVRSCIERILVLLTAVWGTMIRYFHRLHERRFPRGQFTDWPFPRPGARARATMTCWYSASWRRSPLSTTPTLRLARDTSSQSNTFNSTNHCGDGVITDGNPLSAEIPTMRAKRLTRLRRSGRRANNTEKPRFVAAGVSPTKRTVFHFLAVDVNDRRCFVISPSISAGGGLP
ncbi:hypothetical protein KCP70_13160 [Salmonella enterica subsp. enterica]|nr:hypothetical protein KCP70_13160 [Salmonella enterica subsp. enterica]